MPRRPQLTRCAASQEEFNQLIKAEAIAEEAIEVSSPAARALCAGATPALPPGVR